MILSHKCSGFIQKQQWRTKVNILRLAVGYFNVTVNRTPETQNRRLELTAQANRRKAHWLTGTCQGLPRQDRLGQVFVQFWSR
jgi:hypothetical protein